MLFSFFESRYECGTYCSSGERRKIPTRHPAGSAKRSRMAPKIKNTDRPRGRAVVFGKKCELGAGPRNVCPGLDAATFTSGLFHTTGISPHRGRRFPVAKHVRYGASPALHRPGRRRLRLGGGEVPLRHLNLRLISQCFVYAFPRHGGEYDVRSDNNEMLKHTTVASYPLKESSNFNA